MKQEETDKQQTTIDPDARNRKRRNDWILAGAILLAAVVGLLAVWIFTGRTQSQGTKAVLTLDGTVILEQPLTEDCSIPIQTSEGYNLFVVADGTASVQEADCRDQICVEHEAVSQTGDTIVCLPHKLIVEIQ